MSVVGRQLAHKRDPGLGPDPYGDALARVDWWYGNAHPFPHRGARGNQTGPSDKPGACKQNVTRQGSAAAKDGVGEPFINQRETDAHLKQALSMIHPAEQEWPLDKVLGFVLDMFDMLKFEVLRWRQEVMQEVKTLTDAQSVVIDQWRNHLKPHLCVTDVHPRAGWSSLLAPVLSELGGSSITRRLTCCFRTCHRVCRSQETLPLRLSGYIKNKRRSRPCCRSNS